jgi:hypothetical protein
MNNCVPGSSATSAPAATLTPAPPAAQTPASTPAPAATPNPAGTCSPQPCANHNYGQIVYASALVFDFKPSNEFEKPEAGNVFVKMDLSFENRLSQELHANPTEFVLQDSAGIKRTVSSADPCTLWDPVNLAQGAKFGPKCTIFQATAGSDPHGMTLVWSPAFGYDYGLKLPRPSSVAVILPFRLREPHRVHSRVGQGGPVTKPIGCACRGGEAEGPLLEGCRVPELPTGNHPLVYHRKRQPSDPADLIRAASCSWPSSWMSSAAA